MFLEDPVIEWTRQTCATLRARSEVADVIAYLSGDDIVIVVGSVSGEAWRKLGDVCLDLEQSGFEKGINLSLVRQTHSAGWTGAEMLDSVASIGHCVIDAGRMGDVPTRRGAPLHETLGWLGAQAQLQGWRVWTVIIDLEVVDTTGLPKPQREQLMQTLEHVAVTPIEQPCPLHSIAVGSAVRKLLYVAGDDLARTAIQLFEGGRDWPDVTIDLELAKTLARRLPRWLPDGELLVDAVRLRNELDDALGAYLQPRVLAKLEMAGRAVVLNLVLARLMLGPLSPSHQPLLACQPTWFKQTLSARATEAANDEGAHGKGERLLAFAGTFH